jgi:hypothetical protein
MFMNFPFLRTTLKWWAIILVCMRVRRLCIRERTFPPPHGIAYPTERRKRRTRNDHGFNIYLHALLCHHSAGSSTWSPGDYLSVAPSPTEGIGKFPLCWRDLTLMRHACRVLAQKRY